MGQAHQGSAASHSFAPPAWAHRQCSSGPAAGDRLSGNPVLLQAHGLTLLQCLDARAQAAVLIWYRSPYRYMQPGCCRCILCMDVVMPANTYHILPSRDVMTARSKHVLDITCMSSTFLCRACGDRYTAWMSILRSHSRALQERRRAVWRCGTCALLLHHLLPA